MVFSPGFLFFLFVLFLLYPLSQWFKIVDLIMYLYSWMVLYFAYFSYYGSFTPRFAFANDEWLSYVSLYYLPR